MRGAARRGAAGFRAAARRMLRWLTHQGAVAQLVAHLVRNEGVRGSSPLSSTHTHKARIFATNDRRVRALSAFAGARLRSPRPWWSPAAATTRPAAGALACHTVAVTSSPDLASPPPPDSWPGAGGRRSVAPEVPAWPGAAPRSSGGDSWPGARGDSWPGATGSPAAPATPRDGGVAGVLFPAVSVIVAMGVLGLWAIIDGDRREAQGVVLLVVIAAALVALGVSLVRHRGRA